MDGYYSVYFATVGSIPSSVAVTYLLTIYANQNRASSRAIVGIGLPPQGFQGERICGDKRRFFGQWSVLLYVADAVPTRKTAGCGS